MCQKTSLDELEKVESHFNQGQEFVYKPECQQNGKILWHLRKNPPESLKKIIAIGIYKGHAFLIRY